MNVLVANIGSTSLKYRLYEVGDGKESLIARGGFERVTDYMAAIESCRAALGGQAVAAVGFKTVVARGVSGCVRIDECVLAAMEAYASLAPAHNPPYVAAIRQFARRMPETPLVALFETAFYKDAPEAWVRYAVPASWYELGVRKWGFHGASHKFVAERSAELLGRRDIAERAKNLYVRPGRALVGPDLRVVSCHLGGSSSITAIRNGAGVATSMGLSPQSGLPQSDRVGELDAFAVGLVLRATGASIDEIERTLCKESGLRGLSGGPSDVRDLWERADAGDAGAKLALDVFVHQIRHWIGAHLAQLDGADALVFTAGIGENDAALRARICADLSGLGIALDADKNRVTGREAEIGKDGAKVRVLVIPTNEELMVAREAYRLLSAA